MNVVLRRRHVLLPTATRRVMISISFTPPPQDHLLLPASPLLLQHLTAGLCTTSEAVGAAAPDHLGHPPAGDLPEAAVGEPAAPRVPGQPVSERTHCLFKNAAANQGTAPSVGCSWRANVLV